jgi:hypothetical protein
MACDEGLPQMFATGPRHGNRRSPSTGTTAGFIRLHHGTDVTSAQDILHNGLNQASAAVHNVSGEFWTTTDIPSADVFAQVNPVGGIPARLSFDLPEQILAALLAAHPPRVYQQGSLEYEFLPASFPLLNQHMTNRQVVSPVP